MPPDAPTPADPPTPHRTVLVRKKKKRRHGASRLFRDVWIPAAVLAVVLAIFGVRYLSHLVARSQVTGYLNNPDLLEQEYLQYEGKPLNNQAASMQFNEAYTLATKGDFRGAAQTLDSLSRRCALPVVFHNLGLVYAQLNDHPRALRAFREALARDPGYPAVELTLSNLRGFDPHDAEPLPNEVEPNDTPTSANLISLGTNVVGEVSSKSDVDCFRFSAPAAPRDLLRIEVKSQSLTLAPALKVYDSWGHPTGETAESRDPGAPLMLMIAPRQNSTMFVEVSGTQQTTGAYGLKITPMKAYDSFEPNDEIAAAHRIPTGKEIEANIMTGDDNDFYSFTSEGGKMTITLTPVSDGLTPGLVIFGPDQHALQFVAKPEASGRIVQSLDVRENQSYFLQVWGQNKSTGNYRLTVQ